LSGGTAVRQLRDQMSATVCAAFTRGMTGSGDGQRGRSVVGCGRGVSATSFYGTAAVEMGADSAAGCRMNEMLVIRTTSRNPMKAPKATTFQAFPW
jgi:hypothetical protein